MFLYYANWESDRVTNYNKNGKLLSQNISKIIEAVILRLGTKSVKIDSINQKK